MFLNFGNKIKKFSHLRIYDELFLINIINSSWYIYWLIILLDVVSISFSNTNQQLRFEVNMFWPKIKEFIINYDTVLFLFFITFGWVVLYTFFILISVLFFSIK
jgi:hypothetical protein